MTTLHSYSTQLEDFQEKSGVTDEHLLHQAVHFLAEHGLLKAFIARVTTHPAEKKPEVAQEPETETVGTKEPPESAQGPKVATPVTHQDPRSHHKAK